jgi:plasmid stabilization system protein ParE
LGQHIGARWRYRRAGQHRIFYLIHRHEVLVARVLHVSMDERRHFP